METLELVTAEVAKALSNKVKDDRVEDYKETERRVIIRNIKTAIDTGKANIFVNRTIHEENKIHLKNFGYKVEEMKTGLSKTSVKISW